MAISFAELVCFISDVQALLWFLRSCDTCTSNCVGHVIGVVQSWACFVFDTLDGDVVLCVWSMNVYMMLRVHSEFSNVCIVDKSNIVCILKVRNPRIHSESFIVRIVKGLNSRQHTLCAYWSFVLCAWCTCQFVNKESLFRAQQNKLCWLQRQITFYVNTLKLMCNILSSKKHVAVFYSKIEILRNT